MSIRHFAFLFLSALPLSQAAWTVATVDSTATSGFGCSLVLSPNGTPHMAYYRPNLPNFPNFFEVYYATPSGSSWLREIVYDNGTMTPGISTSIALTELGTPAISYTRSSTINYKIRSGGIWSSELTVPGNGGSYSSMLWEGTEAAPTPLIAYQDATLGYVKTALFNGANFNAATQDNSGSAGISTSLAEYGAYNGISYIKGGKLGYLEKTSAGGQTFGAASANGFAPFVGGLSAQACAVAAFPSQLSGNPTDIRPHVILFNGTGYYYTTTDTNNSLWMTPELIETVGSQLQTFQGCSIAVGSDGVVHVAYFDYGTKTLKYAKRTATGWSTPETVDAALGGIACSLRLTAANLPRIAYAAITFDSGSASYVPAGVKYATFANPVALSFTVVGKTKRVSSKSSIKIAGTASSSAVAVEWRIGKKAFKRVNVSGGRWKATCGPLKPGANRLEFRAVSSAKQRTAIRRITVAFKK